MDVFLTRSSPCTLAIQFVPSCDLVIAPEVRQYQFGFMYIVTHLTKGYATSFKGHKIACGFTVVERLQGAYNLSYSL